MKTKARYGMVIKYEDVAAMLACESSDEQSVFFNVFAKELRRNCGTGYHADLQMAYVRGEMDKESLEVMQWNTDE